MPIDTTEENGGNAAEVTGKASSTDTETGEGETERPPARKGESLSSRKKNSAKLLSFPVPSDGWTLKEEKFLMELATNGFKREKAAIAAGYSPTSAAAIASENLSKPKFQDRIKKALAQQQLTFEEVMGHLAAIIRGEAGDVFDDAGNIDWEKVRRNDAGHLIKNPKTGEIYDRLTAIRTYAAIAAAAVKEKRERDATDANRQFIARKVAELAEAEGISEPQALDLLKSLKPDWLDLQRFELPPIEAEIVEEDDGDGAE